MTTLDLDEEERKLRRLEHDLLAIAERIRGRGPTAEEMTSIFGIVGTINEIVRKAIIAYPRLYEQSLVNLGNMPSGSFQKYGQPIDGCIYSIRLFSGMIGAQSAPHQS